MWNKIIKKYTFCIQWLKEDNMYVCRCFEFPSSLSFGDTPEEALQKLEGVIDDLVMTMRIEGERLPGPLSKGVVTGNMHALNIRSDKYVTISAESSLREMPIEDYIFLKFRNSQGE